MPGRERESSGLKGIGRFFEVAPTLARCEHGVLSWQYDATFSMLQKCGLRTARKELF